MKAKFAVSHRKNARFKKRGLRTYFEYRDLGIKRATRGKVVAHVIRARPGKAPHGQWHRHDCKVQFVYVLKGSAVFEYEGVGKVIYACQRAGITKISFITEPPPRQG